MAYSIYLQMHPGSVPTVTVVSESSAVIQSEDGGGHSFTVLLSTLAVAK